MNSSAPFKAPQREAALSKSRPSIVSLDLCEICVDLAMCMKLILNWLLALNIETSKLYIIFPFVALTLANLNYVFKWFEKSLT